MKYLNDMAVVKYEKLLIEHLSLGGDVRDLTGKNLVGQQVLAVWNEEGIRDMCAAQGITMENFCELYSACIETLMPNPCINGGGPVPMLVPTLFLLEDWRIRELLALFTQLTEPDFYKKLEVLKEGMVVVSKKVKAVHDSARGPVQFVITPGGGLPVSAADPLNSRGCGCTSMILVCLALGSISLVVVFLHL